MDTKIPIKTIDGIVGRPQKSVKASNLNGRQPQHIHKQPSSSQTLMRTAVKKPAKSNKLFSAVNSPLNPATPSLDLPLPAGKVDPKLAKRAQSFKLSSKISRFGAAVTSATANPNSSIPAQPEPIKIASNQSQLPKSFLEKAIDEAMSHNQPRLSKKQLKPAKISPPHHKGRLAAYGLISVMALAVIGYAVYANIPNVMVKVASVRAGFNANLPSYRPSGFSLSSVDYQPGTVVFNFNGNLDKRNFSITEHSSSWDSATLVSSVVVPTSGSNYHKLVIDGQSVYLFGNNQATWVTNGVWYQVQGNGSLSLAQIEQMATTL